MSKSEAFANLKASFLYAKNDFIHSDNRTLTES